MSAADPDLSTSYPGKGDTFDRAIADFSAVYAHQNERDYETFAAAVNSGRLVARDRSVGAFAAPERGAS